MSLPGVNTSHSCDSFYLVTSLHIATSLPYSGQCKDAKTSLSLFQTQVECIAAALDCVMKELDGTAKKECNYPEHGIDYAVEFLELKIKEQKNVSVYPHCVSKSSAKVITT